MNCLDWEERIALYTGGDLDPDGAAAVERHLRECAGCQVFASGLAESLACLQTAHAGEIAPAHYTALRARVMASVVREQRRWRWVWMCAPAAVAVALLLLIGLRPRVSRDVTSVPSQANASLPLVPVPVAAPPKAVPTHRAPSRRSRPSPKSDGEQVLVKLETDNPEVVIYWIADSKGEN